MSKQKRYEIHEAAKIMPAMSDAEYRALKDDIAANGLKNPAQLFEGKILDGRHRMEACIDLGMTLKTVKAELNGSTPAEYVLSQNLHRRHLTESQRAMVAARIANLAEGRPEKTASIEAVSQTEAAASLNVSRASVQRAAAVVEDGSAALQAAVASGEVPVSVAATLTALPKDQQTAAVKAGPAAIKKAAAKAKNKAAKKPDKPKADPLPGIDKQIEDCYGRLLRSFDARARACGGRGDYFKAVDDSMGSVLADWKAWKKAPKGSK